MKEKTSKKKQRAKRKTRSPWRPLSPASSRQPQPAMGVVAVAVSVAVSVGGGFSTTADKLGDCLRTIMIKPYVIDHELSPSS